MLSIIPTLGFVIPAKAGIHHLNVKFRLPCCDNLDFRSWIPAFAGMTREGE